MFREDPKGIMWGLRESYWISVSLAVEEVIPSVIEPLLAWAGSCIRYLNIHSRFEREMNRERVSCHAKCTVCYLTVSENDILWVMLRQLWNNQLLFTGILTPLLNCLLSKALPSLHLCFQCVGYSRCHCFSCFWVLRQHITLGELSVLHQGKKAMIYRIWTNLKTVFILCKALKGTFSNCM